MNPFPLPPDARPDDELTARAWNDLIAAIAAGRLLAVDGADVEWTPDGAVLRVDRDGGTLHAVAPSAGIAAAPSATQMTAATAEVYRVDPATGALTDAGYTQPCWHKATGGGITAGKPMLLTLDNNGCWIITWWEC